MRELLKIKGVYRFECVKPDGSLRWSEELHNLVATIGKNLMLDTLLAGSSYSVTGPYLGLISSTSFSAVNAGDTMTSHAGWLEAGNANTPPYTGTRKTLAFSAASGGAKATSAAASFVFTGGGTVQGAFAVLGTGAVNTVDNTGGVLLSASALGSARAVLTADTLNVTYTLSV